MAANIVFGITLKPDGFGNFTGQVTGASDAVKKFGTTGEASGNRVAAGMGRASAGVRSISEQLSRLQNTALAYLGGRMALDVLNVADRYAGLQARLSLVTTSQREFNAANAGLFAIAQANGVQLSATVELYTKLAPALRELGGTQAHALQLSNLVGQSLRLSGTGASQSAAAILQFSQAMGSGVLRGDEFNSLMENSPRLMKAVADGMGLPIGALRKLAEEGKLSAEAVANALLSQSKVLSAEIAKMPLSVSRAWTKLGNTVTLEIARINQASGTTSGIAGALSQLADNIGAVETALISAAKVGVAVFAASLLTAKSAAIAAAGMAGLGMLRNALTGLLLLYQVGGASAVATGILGIGAGARAATPPVLTLGGALKALVWPAALLYGLYEFADYAAKTFLTVKLGIVALAETAQKAAAIISHPLDSKARAAAIAEIKRQNQEIAQALIAEHGVVAPPVVTPVLPAIKVTATGVSEEAKKHAADYAALIRSLDQDLAAARAQQQGLNAAQTELAKIQASPVWAEANARQRAAIETRIAGLSTIQEQNKQEETRKKAAEDYANRIQRLDRDLAAARAQQQGLNAAQTELAKIQTSPEWAAADARQRAAIETRIAETSVIQNQIKQEEARKKAAEETAKAIAHAQAAVNKAREDATDFIDRMNDSARQTIADLEFRASLEGKSALETARLTAERKAQLEIDQQIAELNRQHKNDLPARDAAVAEITRARPGIINNAAAAANAQAIADAHEKEAKRAEQAWERFSENLQRNLGDELFKGLSGKFMDIGDMFKQMLLRMAADAAAAQIMIMGKNLFAALAGAGAGTVGASPPGAPGTAGGGGGHAPGSVFTAKGAWFTSDTAHYYANGGAFTNQTFDRPTPFAFANGGGFNLGVMGEAGPEAVMPLARDASGKLGIQAQGGGRSVNITYAPVIQIDSRSDRAQIERLVGAQIKQGNADLVDRLQREGAL